MAFGSGSATAAYGTGCGARSVHRGWSLLASAPVPIFVGREFSAGTAAGALLPSTNFDVAPQTTTKGTSGGNAGAFIPLGAFLYVYKFSDQFAGSQANRNAVLPIDRQLGNGTDILYEITRDVTAGAAWEFMDAGPGPFSNTRGPLAGTLQGHFSTNYLNFVALNVA